MHLNNNTILLCYAFNGNMYTRTNSVTAVNRQLALDCETCEIKTAILSHKTNILHQIHMTFCNNNHVTKQYDH